MNQQPTRPISEDERETYAVDGVVCLRQLFDPDWIGFLHAAAEDSLRAPGELHFEFAEQRRDPGRFFFETFCWLHNPRCRRFVFDSPAAEIAGILMDAAKVCIFFDQWLIKEPGTPTATPWHHDLPFWPVDGTQICTVWLALDSVTAATGAVEYVKGSHLWGQRYKAESFGDPERYKEDLPRLPDIEAMRDELDFVRYELAPGDCTVHHGLTIHGAPGNATADQRRRALVTRWAGDDAVYHPRPNIQQIPRDPGIPPGAPIECSLWPRVWTRPSVAAAEL